MKKPRFDRRTFLKSAVVSSANAVGVTRPQAGQAGQAPAAVSPPSSPGHAHLNPDERASSEALVREDLR